MLLSQASCIWNLYTDAVPDTEELDGAEITEAEEEDLLDPNAEPDYPDDAEVSQLRHTSTYF